MALLRRDGGVVHANESFRAIVRRNDGIRLRGRMIEFADTEARAKFDSAFAAVLRLRTGAPETALLFDFTAARVAAGRAYRLSVRPLLKNAATLDPPDAVAIVFVCDPLARTSASLDALRSLFALTEAEAVLALALQSGITPIDYARRHALSLNTVYTHLRRLREKTGCSRLPELIHKLNALRLPLRPA
jgi:DNA-binding CsgD family transcriptional regulator